MRGYWRFTPLSPCSCSSADSFVPCLFASLINEQASIRAPFDNLPFHDVEATYNSMCNNNPQCFSFLYIIGELGSLDLLDTADGTQAVTTVDARERDTKPWDSAPCPDQLSFKNAVDHEWPFVRSNVGTDKCQELAATGVVHPMYVVLSF